MTEKDILFSLTANWTVPGIGDKSESDKQSQHTSSAPLAQTLTVGDMIAADAQHLM